MLRSVAWTKARKISRCAVLGFQDHTDVAIKFDGLSFSDFVGVGHDG